LPYIRKRLPTDREAIINQYAFNLEHTTYQSIAHANRVSLQSVYNIINEAIRENHPLKTELLGRRKKNESKGSRKIKRKLLPVETAATALADSSATDAEIVRALAIACKATSRDTLATILLELANRLESPE
jgi:hypothetical protein